MGLFSVQVPSGPQSLVRELLAEARLILQTPNSEVGAEPSSPFDLASRRMHAT